MNSKPIVTALASYGMSGEVFHAPLISANPNFFLKKVCERSRVKIRERYPQTESVKTFEEILLDEEIELVVVNTPDSTHFPLAKQALEAGKHVIVEKPFTQTLAQADELINIAKEKTLILSVFQNRRWDNDFLTVKKVVEQNLLGRIVTAEIRFERYRNYIQANTWKEDASTGASILFNLGPHVIDQALVLFGMPEEIFAHIRKIRTDSPVDDYFDIDLFYKNGLKVRLNASYLVREPSAHFALHGTLGSFIKYGQDPQEAALKTGISPTLPDWGTDSENLFGILNTEINVLHLQGKIETIQGNYPAFYESIFEGIRNQKPLAITANDGKRVILIIEKCLESVLQKKIISI